MNHQFYSLLWRWMIEYFPGSGLQKKDINFCSRNNTSGFRHIFLTVQSQSPPVVFWIVHTYFLMIDIYMYFWARRFTLPQCAEINIFICKKTAFRTLNDRFLFLVRILGLRHSHFRSRIFLINGKFSGTWHVTKLYAYTMYKGRLALCDLQ